MPDNPTAQVSGKTGPFLESKDMHKIFQEKDKTGQTNVKRGIKE